VFAGKHQYTPSYFKPLLRHWAIEHQGYRAQSRLPSIPTEAQGVCGGRRWIYQGFHPSALHPSGFPHPCSWGEGHFGRSEACEKFIWNSSRVIPQFFEDFHTVQYFFFFCSSGVFHRHLKKAPKFSRRLLSSFIPKGFDENFPPRDKSHDFWSCEFLPR